MEGIAIFAILRRHVYLIAALCIVTTLAGYGISFFSPLIPEKYDAAALVLVRPHQPIQIEPNNSAKEVLGYPVPQTPIVETASKTYIQIIQSPSFIGQVVRELKLDQKPRERAPPGDTFLEKMYSYVSDFYYEVEPYVKNVGQVVKYGRPLEVDPYTKAVNDVKKGLTLKAYEDTYAFEIKYSDEDPQTATNVANTTAKLFIKFLTTMSSAEAADAAGRLSSELEQSRQRLVAARESLQDYKEAHGVFLYEPEYDAKLRVISDLTVELAKLDQNLATGTFETKADAEKRARLAKILDQYQADLAGLPTIERELRLRQADVDVANTTYATVAKELKDAEIKADATPEARLISAATVPQVPSSPRRDLIVVASLLTGLMAGVALASLLEYINRTVRGINDIEDVVGLKVIGTIPRVKIRRPKPGRLPGSNHVPHPVAQAHSAADGS